MSLSGSDLLPKETVSPSPVSSKANTADSGSSDTPSPTTAPTTAPTTQGSGSGSSSGGWGFWKNAKSWWNDAFGSDKLNSRRLRLE
ncbi:hypothetical protein KRP22_009630 [Phytophthora ramorum]|nr:hypothetical protein KRP22_14578 [Phytophthora ramorum]KAH7496274.1 hypothetical protein KRP22_14168 [Phytophthora ramorum]